jgi:hypothetical protein
VTRLIPSSLSASTEMALNWEGHQRTHTVAQAILSEMHEIGQAKLVVEQRMNPDYPRQACAGCHMQITDCICHFYAALNDDGRPVPPEAADRAWDVLTAFAAGLAVMGLISWLVEAIW